MPAFGRDGILDAGQIADGERDKAQKLGVDPSQVYAALGTYLATTYVNDFNFLGRTFRVTAQAEPSARSRLEDVGRLQVRSTSGEKIGRASCRERVCP